MNKQEAITEVFVTAFRSLPKKEKEDIAQKLLDDIDTEFFTANEWAKIENLSSQNGEIYLTGKEAKQHLVKL